MAKKINIVTPLLKSSAASGETKTIRVRVSSEQYDNATENAKNTGLSVSQLVLMALEETDVLDKIVPKSEQQSE